MKRDERYDYVHYLYNKGDIKCFNDLFKKLPKSVLAKDMGIPTRRFREMLTDPAKMKVEHLFTVAHFFKINKWVLVQLAWRQYYPNSKYKVKVLPESFWESPRKSGV